jgi:2-iminobutanoate/2-iminopropanoate deaminase
VAATERLATPPSSAVEDGMLATQVIETADAPRAIGPYSQAVVAGDLVFCSGQIGLDPATMELVAPGDVAAQTRRVLDNLAAVLAAAGSDLAAIVKTTIFLADLNDFAVVNQIYGERVGSPPPARATVQVARLPRDARVEIDAIAVKR